MKIKKIFSSVLAMLLTIFTVFSNLPTQAASKSTVVPQVQFASAPVTEYNVGDRVSFNIYSPNYGGRVEYRVVLWNDSKKSYSDLWNSSNGYPTRYYSKWQPYGNDIFTSSWIINEPGSYRITVYAKRVGIPNSKGVLKGMNCDSYLESVAFRVKSNEATVESVLPLNDINISQGQIPTLPQTVKVVMKDKTEKDLKVTWGQVDTSNVGTFTIEGQLENTDKKATLKLIAHQEVLNVYSVEALNSKLVNVSLKDYIKFIPALSRFTIRDSNNNIVFIESLNLTTDKKTIQLSTEYMIPGNWYTLKVEGTDYRFQIPYLSEGESPPVYNYVSVTALDRTVEVGNNVASVVTTSPQITTLSFSSADRNIASVDSDGKITGVFVGTTTISVSACKTGYVTGHTTFLVTVVPRSIPKYKVTFNIIDEDGNKLDEASVDFNGEVKETINGVAEFNNICAANNIHYSITKTGYVSEGGSLNVVDSDVADTFILRVTPPTGKGMLYGLATSKLGGHLIPLPNTKVNLMQNNQIIRTTNTCIAGIYIINNIPSGDYIIEFVKEYYAPVTQNVKVEDKKCIKANAELNLNPIIEGAISGLVTYGLKPISGLAINIKDDSGIVASTTTNSLGLYSVIGIQEGTYTVEFIKGDLNKIKSNVLIAAKKCTIVNQYFEDQELKAIVRGTIRFIRGLEQFPICGAKIIIKNSNGEKVAEGISSDNGQFIFNEEAIIPGRYTIEIEREGFEPVVQALVVNEGETTTTDAELQATAGTVLGIVIGEDFLPVSGVNVGFQDTERSAITNNFGIYFITNVSQGSYNVLFEKSGYITETKNVNISGTFAIVNQTMVKGTADEAAVYGTVKSNIDSTLVLEAIVRLNPDVIPQLLDTLIPQDMASVKQWINSSIIGKSDPEEIISWLKQPIPIVNKSLVQIMLSLWNPELVLNLVPNAPDWLKDLILDIVPNDINNIGIPIVGAKVVIKDSQGNKIAQATTSLDGSYKIAVQPGSYTLEASRIGYVNSIMQVSTEIVGKKLVDINLTPAPGTVAGFVFENKDSKTVPCEGAKVTVITAEGKPSTITNKFGWFSIAGIRSLLTEGLGVHRVEFDKDGYYLEVKNAIFIEGIAVAGATLKEAPPFGTVSGSAKISILPIAGVDVAVKGMVGGQQVEFKAVTDQDGNYAINDIPVGVYSVEFKYEIFSFPITETKDGIEVKAGKTTIVNLDSKATKGIAGKVAFNLIGLDIPVSGVKVKAINSSTSEVREVVTSGLGEYTIANLPAGNYTVETEQLSYSYKVPILGNTISFILAKEKKDNIVVSNGDQVEVNFALREAGKIAKLENIKLDGTNLDGFNEGKFSYDITLPPGTTTAPIVNATAPAEISAAVGITQATLVNGKGTASIVVTAEDGNTTKTYTINFEVAKNIVGVTNPTAKTVPFRTAFSGANLPQTVEVTLDDNSKVNLNVQWTGDSYNGDVAGEYKIKGNLETSELIKNPDGLQAEVIVTVEVEIVTITVINNIKATVNQGETYTMPLSVTATMSNGTPQEVSVTWEPLSIDTLTTGDKTAEGTVLGYSPKVLLTVTVNEAYGTISGKVSAKNTAGLVGISGVTVNVKQGDSIIKSTTTVDAGVSLDTGKYTLSDISAGTYTLEFVKDGYVTKSEENILVGTGENKVVNSEIEQNMGKISGYVLYKNFIWVGLEGATIKVMKDSEMIASGTAVAVIGYFSIDVTPGTYTVIVEKGGYKTQTFTNITVIAGGTIDMQQIKMVK